MYAYHLYLFVLPLCVIIKCVACFFNRQHRISMGIQLQKIMLCIEYGVACSGFLYESYTCPHIRQHILHHYIVGHIAIEIRFWRLKIRAIHFCFTRNSNMNRYKRYAHMDINNKNNGEYTYIPIFCSFQANSAKGIALGKIDLISNPPEGDILLKENFSVFSPALMLNVLD